MRQSSLAKVGDIDAVSISIDREVASKYDDIKIVADNIDSITDVANATVTTAIVAANIGVITAVGSNIDAVIDVHNNSTNIVTIIDNFTNISTVADNIVNINDVASSIIDVSTVSANIADVSTVVGSITQINQVAADTIEIHDIVNTVVPNIAEILQADSNAVIATAQAALANTARVAAEVAQVAAEAKADEANLSMVAADISADLAAASASIASTKASDASASATAARNSELAAASILDAFDDVYLGAYTNNPLVDNDGNPLISGALYFNTVAHSLRVYDAGMTEWIALVGASFADMQDVLLTSVSTGDVLEWNGTKWINTAPKTTITGNAGTATKLQTPRAIQVSGAVTGTVDFDGSAAINIVTTNTAAPIITLAGDATGSVTLTNLESGTLAVNIVDDSHNHIISNVDGLQTALEAKVDNTEKGAANGIATLDTNGKVVLSQINDSILGQLEYKGVWNFSVMPTATEKGQYWIASVAGSGYEVGDWAVYNGVTFDKVDNTDAVASVAGKTGVVVLTKSDVGLNSVDNTADSTKNVLSATKWTDGRTITIGATGKSVDGSSNISWSLVEIGAQAQDATLTALAGVTTAADKMVYATGADAFTTTTLTAAGRALLDDVDTASQRTTLEISATNTPSTAVGNISATNVQAAIAELDSEKVAKVASTDNAIARFDGTTGAIQNSGVVIDDSGNLGLGVTPSAWNTNSKAIEIGNSTAIENFSIAGADALGITNNAYRNTSNAFIYKESDYASNYYQFDGAHVWQTAPSGTAGNAITWTTVMSLDASSNLAVTGTVQGTQLKSTVVTGTAPLVVTSTTPVPNLTTTNLSGGSVDATTGSFSGDVTFSGDMKKNGATIIPMYVQSTEPAAEVGESVLWLETRGNSRFSLWIKEG